MKKQLLFLMMAISFLSCKKDDQTSDTSLKTITYSFSTGGANSQVIYYNNEKGQTVNAAYNSVLYSVSDQVKIGDKIKLQMSTTGTITSNFEIRATYNNKQIASNSQYQTDAAGTKYIIVEKTLTESDFK